MEDAPPAYQELPVEGSSGLAGPLGFSSTSLIESLFVIPEIDGSPLKRSAQITRPLALCQIDSAVDAPFVNAGFMALSEVAITYENWASFLHGLHQACERGLPTTILDAVEGSYTQTPFHFALTPEQQTSTTEDFITVRPSLADQYLLRANKLFLNPRGLHVRIMRGEALRVLVDLPPSKTPVSTTIGRGTDTLINHVPLPVVNPLARLAKGIIKSASMSSYRALRSDYAVRRMGPFEGRVERLDTTTLLPDVDVPLPHVAVQIESQNRQARKAWDAKVASVANGVSTADQVLNGQEVSTNMSPRQVRRQERRARRGQLMQPKQKDEVRQTSAGLSLVRRADNGPADKSVWLVVYRVEGSNLADLDSSDTLNNIIMGVADFEEQIENELAIDVAAFKRKGKY